MPPPGPPGHQVLNDAPDDHAFVLLDERRLCADAVGLDVARVREVAAFARERSVGLVEALVDRGGVAETDLLAGLARALHARFVDAWPDPIPPEVLGCLSPALAISHHVMPLEEVDGRLRVACADPFDWQRWDELAHVLRRPLERVLCPRAVIERLLKANYGIGADTVQHLVADRDAEAVQVLSRTTTDLSEEEAANEPTVVNLVNQILSEAIRAGATDIHFEPNEGRYRVRYRVDGMLEDVSVPVSVHLLKLALVSRIKIMSNLDITEKRLPQDGRCQVSLAGLAYDLRVSILPGVFGEAVVIRLQQRQMVQLDLSSLGFEDLERERIVHLVTRPHGLVLATGPTGSGKTTTLYTCLTLINKPETKIITIEDPVEYWMDNILQMQVQEEIKFSFARALRGMLRHDPDVLLIGEIRDRETADIAIRSALTGHMVFATLHTNDAASGVTRLLDLGIEPFLLASCVTGIIAQRLVRTLCTRCRREARGTGLSPAGQQALTESALLAGATLWEGAGCERCRFTGYRGRTAAAEVLTVTSAIRRLIQQREPAEGIKQEACAAGMRTLRESGLRAVRDGRTDLAEVLRVTQEDG